MQYDKNLHDLVSRRFSGVKLTPRTVLIGIAGVALVGFIVYRLAGDILGGGQRERQQPPPPVEVSLAEQRDFPVTVETLGRVVANATVSLKSQVDGQLLSANFREGQLVKAGDVLFRIDPKPIEAAYRQAQANVEQDRAQFASAKSDAARAAQLAERGAVSTQQRDQLAAAAKALEAKMSSNLAALDRAKLQLSYTEIRAPFDAKTGPILVHPGNLVRANDANPLVVLTQVQPVKISFSLPQSYLPALQDRLREDNLVATVNIHRDNPAEQDRVEDEAIEVKVDFIDNVIEESTGTIQLRATFDNADLRLVPGELVDVKIRLDTLKNAVVVPRMAVNNGQDGLYVWVIGEQMKAQMRPVRVAYQNQTVAALVSGVDKGERVVVDGQLRLNPDVTVVLAGASREAGNGGREVARGGATP